MTATAYVRLYQEGHARSTGYQVTEWVDTAHTSGQLLEPFLMARNPPEVPDAFERVATPIDLALYDATTLGYFELRGGDVDPYAEVITNLGLSGICYLVLRTGALPHWDVSTAINTVSYASSSDEQEFRIGGCPAIGQGTGVKAVATDTLYLGEAAFTPDDVGTWIFLSGMTTSANNGAAKILTIEGQRVTVFRPAGNLAVENCTNAYWSKKFLLFNTKPFLRKEARMSWVTVRVDGGPSIPINSGSIGVIHPVNAQGAFYRTNRITLLFSTLEQAQSHMTSVKSYLEALQVAQNTIDENETFGTLGPFDYPAE